ncbi:MULTISPECIES: DUF1328 domain-containing protein [Kiloniella]|uniref:DUF1328 domain-containing protein n=1 Tax=Kiloniella TaxID=454159 RepID=UPI000A278E59|nr:DUF1328 domain-containing protein [Kiloniella majae]
MLRWALIFFILALLTGVLGFGGIAGTFAMAAKWLFIAFVVLFAITIIANLVSGKKTNPPI